nr:hypothetical protein CFP56_09200 [Quercus suber]
MIGADDFWYLADQNSNDLVSCVCVFVSGRTSSPSLNRYHCSFSDGTWTMRWLRAKPPATFAGASQQILCTGQMLIACCFQTSWQLRDDVESPIVIRRAAHRSNLKHAPSLRRGLVANHFTRRDHVQLHGRVRAYPLRQAGFMLDMALGLSTPVVAVTYSVRLAGRRPSGDGRLCCGRGPVEQTCRVAGKGDIVYSNRQQSMPREPERIDKDIASETVRPRV